MNQNDDDMSCVTGVTVTTGTTFFTQNTQFNLLQEFGHVSDKAQSVYKTNWESVASGHLQAFMDVINIQLGEWEDLEHCHMTHNVWG